MAQPIIDQLLKNFAEYHADELIRLVIPEADFRIVRFSVDKELIFKTLRINSATKIATDTDEYLVHFEFQTEYDPNIAKRIFLYAASLTSKYDLDVISILFQIKPPPKIVKQLDQYSVSLGGRIMNSFQFQCVKLWEHRDDILSGDKKYLNFVPLLLELFPKPDKSLLTKQRELIQLAPDSKRRAELSLFCLALASKYFDINFLRKFFKEDVAMIETLEELPFVGEKIKAALDKGMREGMKEGVKEGMKEGIRSDIIDILETKFQSVDGLERLINSINDISKLKKVLQIALKADTLESFKNLCAKLN